MTLLALCLGWVAGIAIEPSFDSPLWVWLTAGTALTAAGLFAVRGRARWTLLTAAAFAFGAARMRATAPLPGPSFIGYYVDAQRQVTLSGRVAGDPLLRPDGMQFPLVVDRLLAPAGEVETPRGLVLVRMPRPAPISALDALEFEYGDTLILRGALTAPEHDKDFDYAAYLAHHGVYALLERPHVLHHSAPQTASPRARIYRFRHRAYAALVGLMPAPEREVMAGILLGIESGIPEATREAFNATGTTHIIAISGFNISIIAGALLGFTRRVPRRWPGWIVAVAGVGLYTVLVGAAPSVVRAAIMGSLGILARQIGRRTFALGALALSAAIMTAASPGALWDSGFQLSFAATFGLVAYADPMQSWAERRLTARLGPARARQVALGLSEYLLLTLAAQMTTLPLILLNFGRLSLASLFVNPLILPAQPMVMVLGAAATLGALAWPWLGRVLGMAAWVPMAYTTRLVEWFAGMPWAAQPIAGFTPAAAAGMYAALGLVSLAVARGGGGVGRMVESGRAKYSTAALGALALSAVLTWQWALALPDGRLHLRLLSVDGGEALLLTTPSRRKILINAGPNPQALAVALAREMPLGGGTFDWVILASTDEEGNGGLSEVITRHKVLRVAAAQGVAEASPSAAAFLHACAERAVPIETVRAGSRFDLGQGAELIVLGETDRGLLMRVVFGRARFVLPLGVDPGLLQTQVDRGYVAPAQVLLLGEGGYSAVNSPPWVEAVDPWVALLSTGLQSSSRPSLEVLQSLQARLLLRTDVHGWIDVATDGENLWVRSER